MTLPGVDTLVAYPAGVSGITITGKGNQGKVRSVRVLDGYGSGVHYGVHNSSLVNLTRGVAERVLYVRSDEGLLQPCRKPKAGVFERLSGFRDRLVKCLRPTTVVDRCNYASLYSGRKQKIYQRAFESLSVKGFGKSDAYVSTFVKAEKVNFSAKGDPAPRVIQPRSPRYNLEVGRYLKLFEKELCHGFVREVGYKVVLKGCNADETARHLRDSWERYSNPVAIGLDASRFDQHVSVDALQFEHSVYNRVFNSPELAKLLRMQLKNHGFGRIGDSLVKYVVDGCRMSGDINTGMGNCLIMSVIVLCFFEAVGIDARLANNGDDCVVICERKSLQLLEGIEQWFTDFGFKLKREPVVTVFEKIEFCQTQPVLVGKHYRMVRNPWTAMSKDCVSLLQWDNPEQFDTWRQAIGSCGGELTKGVPVWESFYSSIRGNATKRSGGMERVYDSGLGFMATGVCDAEVSAEGRYSFWKAFDIDPDFQVAIEAQWPGINYDPISLNTYTLVNNSNPLACLNNLKTNL